MDVLEFRPLLGSDSWLSAGRPSRSSRLFPAGTEVRLLSSYSRSSGMATSFLRGPSRGVDRGSEGLAGGKVWVRQLREEMGFESTYRHLAGQGDSRPRMRVVVENYRSVLHSAEFSMIAAELCWARD